MYSMVQMLLTRINFEFYNNTMSSKTKSIIYVLLCVLLWALIPVVSKLGQTELDNHQFLFWSSLVSMLSFVAILISQKRISALYKLSFNNWLQAIGLGFLGTYLYYILLYFGYAKAQGLEVLIIQYCWPIFVVLLSVLILKEKLNVRKSFSVLLGFFGVFLVLSQGNFSNISFDNFFVDGIVLLAAFVFGLFSVLSKKNKTDDLLLVTIYFITATVVSFFSMSLMSDFKLPTVGSLLPILINGIFVNGVSYIFWIKALKKGDASFIAPFVFLTPVISSVFLILFFNEPFLKVYLFGLLAVVFAGLINRK